MRADEWPETGELIPSRWISFIWLIIPCLILGVLVGLAAGIALERKLGGPTGVVFHEIPRVDSLSSTSDPIGIPSLEAVGVTRRLFGVALGENMTMLQSRYEVTASKYRFADADHPGKVWDVATGDSEVKVLRASSLHGKIYSISVSTAGASEAAFDAIKKQLINKYGGGKMDLKAAASGEVWLDTSIDGVEVQIRLNRFSGAADGDRIELRYTHRQLAAALIEEFNRRKAEKLAG